MAQKVPCFLTLRTHLANGIGYHDGKSEETALCLSALLLALCLSRAGLGKLIIVLAFKNNGQKRGARFHTGDQHDKDQRVDTMRNATHF
jgi:hypothetical protein